MGGQRMASELTIGGLDEWADNLEAAYDLTVEEQARITLAGAKVLEKNMKAYIKDQHYQNRKTGEDPHLADSVKSQGKNVDGVIDGTSVVGFPDEKAYIANFISGGTKHVIYDSSKFHGKSARTLSFWSLALSITALRCSSAHFEFPLYWLFAAFTVSSYWSSAALITSFL